jgi:uncharacterized protein (TIGR03435 family)
MLRPALILALVGSVVMLSAQSSAPVSAGPNFEVASVRDNQSGALGASLRPQPDGSLTAVNNPLRVLIEFAYQLPPDRILGIPDWANSARYDITARVGDVPPPSEQAGLARSTLRLRSLLADRFRLKAHTETRELPIYELRLARVDGRLGPRLVQSNRPDCQMTRDAFSSGSRAPLPPPAENRLGCGVGIGVGYIYGGDIPLAELVEGVSRVMQRNVVDRTGLTGRFDAELTFNQEQLQFPFDLPGAVPPPQVDPNAASIFTALQEQLGLKLESARGPVEVLVIDSVERPTPD